MYTHRGNKDRGRDWNDAATPKKCWEPLVARKRQGKIIPESLQKKHDPADNLISDIQAPEPGENKFLF